MQGVTIIFRYVFSPLYLEYMLDVLLPTEQFILKSLANRNTSIAKITILEENNPYFDNHIKILSDTLSSYDIDHAMDEI